MWEHRNGVLLYLCETDSGETSSGSEIDKDEFQQMQSSEVLLESRCVSDNSVNVVQPSPCSC
jgi:hypothetical protein